MKLGALEENNFSACSLHRRGGQREGSQEYLSWDLQSKERAEGAAHKAEGGTVHDGGLVQD